MTEQRNQKSVPSEYIKTDRNYTPVELWRLAPRAIGTNDYEGEYGYAVSVLSNKEGKLLIKILWDDGGEDNVLCNDLKNANEILERRF